MMKSSIRIAAFSFAMTAALLQVGMLPSAWGDAARTHAAEGRI